MKPAPASRKAAPRKRSAAPAFVPPPGSDDNGPAPIDRHFATLVVELHGAPFPELEAAAQSLSAWRGAGHSCMPLEALGVPGLADTLRSSPVVGAPGDHRPLILDREHRLYLQRYWACENTLARAIRSRLGPPPPGLDPTLLAKSLARYFPGAGPDDLQQKAVAAAATGRFAVITGGPGTGKTRTVVALLAVLIEQFQAQGRTPRIALAAPTGKAAARLTQSISETAAALALPPQVRALLPGEAATVHRLLGNIPGSSAFRHNAGRPLPLDLLIVDEASMADLLLMAALFEALGPQTRVVLLGDKDQLASVEAGYVLGDICQPPPGTPNSAPLHGRIVELRKNYRFKDDSAIHRLSTLVNSGDADGVLRLLGEGTDPALRFAPTPAPAAMAAALRQPLQEGFRACLTENDPRAALARLNDFRILCALRQGPCGVAGLNRMAEHLLAQAGLIHPGQTHYHGRPVIILQNAYDLNLFNGDTGLILRDPEAGGQLRAFFLDSKGALQRLLPTRLPEHESVFAMTVHKSQGSEFRRLLFVLPERDTPVASRELVYTALTRAREAVTLWAPEAVLAAAIARTTARTSGLRSALWLEPA